MRLPAKATLACAVGIVLSTVTAMLSGVLPTLVLVILFALAALGAVAFAAVLVPALAFLLWHPGLLVLRTGAQKTKG